MMNLVVDATKHCLQFKPDEEGFRLSVPMGKGGLVLYISHEQAAALADGVRCWQEDSRRLAEDQAK